MQKDKHSTVLIFLINGINSLLGWNAVLASLDFFANSFKDYSVYSFLPIPLFVAYLAIGASYHEISNRFRYVNLIITGNMITNIGLISILIFSILLKGSLVGFIVILICSFVIGVGGNTSQLTFFAMINYLSQDVVSKFTVGTAVSGLLITIIRAIITAIFGSEDKSSSPIIIYFVVAVVVNSLNIVMNIFFCKSSVYKHKIDHFLLHRDKEKVGEAAPYHSEPNSQDGNSGMKQPINPPKNVKAVDLVEQVSKRKVRAEISDQKEVEKKKEKTEGEEEEHHGTDNSSETSQPINQNYIHEEERIENQSYYKTMFETLNNISPYPYYIMINFVITFTLFPGPMFSRKFPDLDDVWQVIIFNMAYNIGDTVGKYSAGIKNIFNPKSLLFVFLSRLYFFFPVTFLAKGWDFGDVLTDNYFFPFFICFLFAFTNGFVVNSSFIMAFQVAPLIFKKYAGVLCGLMLQMGLMLGTVVQLPYSLAFGINT